MSIAPADYITGYQVLASAASAPAAGVFIPLTSFPGLTEAQLSATTGDIRSLSRAIDLLIATKLASLQQPALPDYFNCVASTPSLGQAGFARQIVTKTYDLDLNTARIAGEPA